MSPTRTTTVFEDLSRLAAAAHRSAFKAQLWSRAEEIRNYLLSFELENAPPDLIPNYVSDALPRFLRTLEFIPLPLSGPVLEVGSNPYLFHLLLYRIFPQIVIEGCNFFDHNIFAAGGGTLTQSLESATFGERYSFSSQLCNLEVCTEYPYVSDRFELVFFCETLEHLIVDPLAVFSRLWRILQPGGHLLVTVPNAVRLTNIALMLEGKNFFDLYSSNGPHGRHNREYTLEELTQLLTQNQFHIVTAETWDRCDYDLVTIWSYDYTGHSHKLPRTRSTVLEVLRSCNASTENRGDNLYVLAQKPMI